VGVRAAGASSATANRWAQRDFVRNNEAGMAMTRGLPDDEERAIGG
jgi:hypothetical protein